MPIAIDIINGAKGKLTAQGWEFYRMGMVTGLGGSGPTKLKGAVTVLGVNLGDAYPDGSVNARLEEIDPEALSTGVVRVQLIYREHYPSTLIGVGASVVQQTVNTDYQGNPMTVKHDTAASTAQSVNATASIHAPQTTLEFTRQENASPGDNSDAYVGLVNSVTWNADPGAQPRQWLCTSIKGTTRDGGNTYEVQYSFQRSDAKDSSGNVIGWDQELQYVDPKTGIHDTACDDTVARKVFKLYQEIDFNNLSLV